MNDKKKNEFKLTEYAHHGEAYAVGTVILLAMDGTEAPLLKFVGYSFLSIIFGAVVMAIGAAVASVATETGSKWVKRLKLVASLAVLGAVFYMIAGGNF